MKPAPRRWEVLPASPIGGFHPVLGQVLAARGHDEITAEALLTSHDAWHDPLQLRGMAEAVRTVGEALARRQRIAIYGDYDADGVSGCALLTLGLRSAGADVVPYIPNRMTEGYGLHGPALRELADRGVACVITVDCGTSSVDAAATRPSGLRLVITDHHLPLAPDNSPPALAPADALVNPKQPGCEYPFDGLAGAGVAWKLLAGLEQAGWLPGGTAEAQVGLAALGTVADMMPLRGENRTIVRAGLAALSRGANVGISALVETAGLPNVLRASDIAFGVGPRINAAGRMEDARLALDLCLCEDRATATALATRLNAQNVTRQAAVARALAQAEDRVCELPDDCPAIVIGDPEWPMGIVGLVAGRLAERYARPTLVACLDPVESKGSARAVPGVHIVDALAAAAPTLLRYGGHAAAAGFSLLADNFEAFREAVTTAVAEQMAGRPTERRFAIDAAVHAEYLVPALCREMHRLEPCGIGNASPLLAIGGAEVLAVSSFGSDRQHQRITLSQRGALVEAIAFHKPGLARHLPRGRLVDICFSLELDTWDGQERVRARLRDIRPHRAGESDALVPLQADRPVLASSER